MLWDIDKATKRINMIFQGVNVPKMFYWIGKCWIKQQKLTYEMTYTFFSGSQLVVLYLSNKDHKDIPKGYVPEYILCYLKMEFEDRCCERKCLKNCCLIIIITTLIFLLFLPNIFCNLWWCSKKIRCKLQRREEE